MTSSTYKGNASQDLKQKVCQRFGWSITLKKDLTDNLWKATIITGLSSDPSNCYNFVASKVYARDKEGKADVSEIALKGLADRIDQFNALPAKDLTNAFSSIFDQIEILDSNDASSWKRFWDDAPTMVGIDTEGNQIVPPVLVQVATQDFVILETPQKGKKLSANLLKLLRNDHITKVFCDNFSHKDKTCLGIPLMPQRKSATKKGNENVDTSGATDVSTVATTTSKDVYSYTEPPIVDLESLCMRTMGPVQSARGLAKIVALVMPELRLRIEKPKSMKGRFANIGKYAMIEQGKAKPLRGIFDLKPQEQRYAALDAWCTLQAYLNMIKK